MARIVLEDISASYGSTPVLSGVELVLESGELHTLLGRSGCGKTTILRLIAGFLKPDCGRILVDGEDVTPVPPDKRHMGVVFQSYALFPQMTVAENIAYGLKVARAPKAERQRVVGDLLELLGLEALGSRNALELSGGQQQRVAIARALAPSPSVLLLDEPMANLDAELRVSLRGEIKRIQETLGVTTLFITHDQAEALAISDRITVMDGGVIQQTGTPQEIYERPATDFVAEFVGTANRFGATFVRPESLQLLSAPNDGAWFRGTVASVVYMGYATTYGVLVDEVLPGAPGGGKGALVEVLMLNNAATRPYAKGETAWVASIR